MKLSNTQVDEVARRAAAPPMPGVGASDAEVRRWLSRVGRARVSALGRLELARARTGGPVSPGEVVAAWRRCRRVLAQAPPLEVGELAVDGRDLIRLGLKPGPRFGTILAGLLEWVLEDPTRNEPEALLARAGALAGDGEADG
jgi:tRNA nucleotidyltransferase (CCA-adding enzyme)